jgi:hypothetical protein
MNGGWMIAIEQAADVLGEMLVEVAEGRGRHDNEDIAAAVLQVGLAALLERSPEAERLDDVGRVLYAKLHNGGEQRWEDLAGIERGFWLDLAAAAVGASDAALLRVARPGAVSSR